MKEILVTGKTLPETYHKALVELYNNGELVPCPDYNTTQKEVSMTMYIEEPFKEPMISRLFIGGFYELEQYCEEILDGILDFEIDKGKWAYTYHNRVVAYPIRTDHKIDYANQLIFVIDELKRNPWSRRAVIDIRDNSQDMYSEDPACLQHIQYFIRDNKLDCKVLFRSNDACKATFMNAFALIQLQKRIADSLNIEVGTYTHRVNSFHCYKRDFNLLKGYIKRIYSNEEFTYDYKNEWDILMLAARPQIEEAVRKLKEN